MSKEIIEQQPKSPQEVRRDRNAQRQVRKAAFREIARNKAKVRTKMKRKSLRGTNISNIHGGIKPTWDRYKNKFAIDEARLKRTGRTKIKKQRAARMIRKMSGLAA